MNNSLIEKSDESLSIIPASILMSLHFIVLLLLSSLSKLGGDMAMYYQYCKDFHLLHSMGGSYGPFFYLVYVPIYLLNLWFSKSIMLSIALSINILSFMIIDIYIWKHTHNQFWLVLTMISTPLFYSLSFLVDQRNDIVVVMLLMVSLYYFDKEKIYLASFIGGLAVAMKWIPALGLLPLMIYYSRREEEIDFKCLSIQIGLASAPLICLTLLMFLLGYQDILVPYQEHLYRSPQGNNIIHLLSNLEKISYPSLDYLTLLLQILFLASLAILCFMASKSSQKNFSWVSIVFLLFMITSKVSNNQYMMWVYYPLLLDRKARDIVILQITILLMQLKAGVDTIFKPYILAFWYPLSIALEMIICISLPLVTLYLVKTQNR
ncbi:MAG: DUF2029 domain-containing protein [Candidatus Heimdallarchaeota archaeon]|nr:DUF2029 domain-containing protein [Candidatus Heimdallarchaeota archaeon]